MRPFFQSEEPRKELSEETSMNNIRQQRRACSEQDINVIRRKTKIENRQVNISVEINVTVAFIRKVR